MNELPTPMRCIELLWKWYLGGSRALASFELKNKLSATCRGRSRGYYPFYRNTWGIQFLES